MAAGDAGLRLDHADKVDAAAQPAPRHPTAAARALAPQTTPSPKLKPPSRITSPDLQPVPLAERDQSGGPPLPDAIAEALARQAQIEQDGLLGQPIDRKLLRVGSWRDWLRREALPLQLRNGRLLLAVSRPEKIDALRQELHRDWPLIEAVFVPREALRRALSDAFATEMAGFAATRVDGQFSCRRWSFRRRVCCVLPPIALVAACFIAPPLGFAALSLLAVASLICFSVLRLFALLSQVGDDGFAGVDADQSTRPVLPAHLPRISVLVPLYKETEIAPRLVRRLSRLTYPKHLLEVVLVLEEEDTRTRGALLSADLPGWMRIQVVPGHGTLRTKPRAMNYALDFCDGDIIGIWDAEDAPAPDQLERVVAGFARAPADVACLQGILDYYNATENWLSRCFAVEYASWFRIVMPGISRLGLVMPLGGTTLFVKRKALEDMGGWDAHNVTEDADLGVRLHRFGYRTQMVWTVTGEEAACRPIAWVKQRSRWLKGFMITYMVHMRRPIALWRDLGWARFLGVQAFFLGSCGQFLLSPIVWTFWLILLGLEHPAGQALPQWVVLGSAALFLMAELVNMTIGWLAMARPGMRRLRWVLPTMGLYYLLGALAAYKALYELARIPFYWDKTQHGQDKASRHARLKRRPAA